MNDLALKILYNITETDRISDSELVQSVLTVNAETADAVLDHVGGVKGLKDVERIGEIKGIDLGKTARIRAAELLGRRMNETSMQGDKFTSSKAVYAHFAPKLEGSRHEEFWALFLDNRNRIVGEYQVAVGGWTCCQIDPKCLFQKALLAGALSIILVHNHPSGDPNPSSEDHDMTSRLKTGAESLGLTILDHVIVASDAYFSFADTGRL